jgi:hypothetical protein
MIVGRETARLSLLMVSNATHLHHQSYLLWLKYETCLMIMSEKEVDKV